MTKLKGGIINTFITISGLVMLEIVWAYKPDYAAWEIVFYSILGLLIFAFGIFMFGYRAHKKKKSKMDCSAIKEDEGTDIFVKFRKGITDFFLAKVVKENMSVQYACTQLYMNVIKLQKERLDKLKVSLKFHSMAKYEGEYHSLDNYYDGKYSVREIEQEISAKKIFYKDKKAVLIKDENEMVHYTLINAKKVGDNQVVCPNCGNVSPREDLIDGCDYCSTKFSVEDLGEKISNSTFRDSADLAYDKFKRTRVAKIEKTFLILFSVLTMLVIAVFAIVMSGDGDASGDYFNPLIFTICLVAMAGFFGILLAAIAILGYVFVVMPLMEAFAFIKYNSKKRAEQLRKNEENDKLLQQKIREYDSLFSIQGFYSNIQNKISTIIFSNKTENMNQFGKVDLNKYFAHYKNVIDYDVQKMSMKDYNVEGNLQVADLETDLKIFSIDGKKVKEGFERIQMKVVKSVDCKTQVIGAPQVVRCKSCGSSLSYSNGLVCEYCGSKPDLKNYDWEISEYLLLK